MTEDIYMTAILLLLPLTAGMLVSQVNPYHALVLRGILGAVAALVYALFGAADVALTEALVGTMLSITLYAVAVRSSMSMRLGVLETTRSELPAYDAILSSLRSQLQDHQLRLEVVPFSQTTALKSAFANKEVHAVFTGPGEELTADAAPTSGCLQIRVRRLYDMLRTKLPHDLVNLRFGDLEDINVSGRKAL